ncbi:hypothetical protein GCM10009801_21930 [Streptomyces albiaxialis]|uniref:Septum formation initiator n=1 Tax=Streptomyces albiaxialis TaxID=329523 RepID=A0ABN2VWF8_9ACTN
MAHSEEQDHEPGGVRRRRIAAGAWVCAVGAAFLLGAWSFSHADPGGQYGRPEPLGEGAVRHELSQERAKAEQRSASVPDTDPAPAPGEDDDGSSSASPSAKPTPTPTPARTPRVHTATVRFPDGLGTAVAECREDATTVKLLSWSPAEGYSADDVEPGPAARASVELEPLADDADEHTVVVRCADGKPRTAYEGDDAEDSADD